MRLLPRFLAAIFSLFLSFALILSLFLFGVTWTGIGRKFLHDQTERIAAGLMGSGYVAELGRQTLGVGVGGSVEITWRDIRLGREGSSLPTSEVRRLTVGLNPLELIEGRFAIRSIAMAGATIDLTRAPRAAPQATIEPAGEAADEDAPRRIVQRVMGHLFQVLDREAASLGASGIRRVEISDITLVAPIAPGGGPFVSRIERADLETGSGGSARLAATIGIDDFHIAASGDATFDASRKKLTELHLSLGPLDIGQVAPPGPPEDRLDTRPFASDAKISLRLDLATPQKSLGRDLTLTLGIGSGAVQIGKGHSRIETGALVANYREGEDHLALEPSLFVFDGVSLSLGGQLGPSEAPGEDLAFRLAAKDIRSTIGAASDNLDPRKAEVGIEGTFALGAKRITLAKAVIDAASGRIDGGGEIGLGAPDAVTRIRLGSQGLAVDDVKAFWPFNIAPNARRWVVEHLSGGGSARNVLFALDLTRARLGKVFKPKEHPAPNEMRLALDFDGLDLASVGDLPGLDAAAGHLETLGGDTTIQLASATANGMETVVAMPSTATFVRSPKISRKDVDLTLDLSLVGDLSEILDIATRRPIGAFRDVDLKPENASGKASVDAKITFELGDDVPKGSELQGYAVDLQLEGAALAKSFGGRSLAALSGPISIVPGAAEGDLKGTVDGFPATIRFGQPFGPTPAVDRRLAVDLSLDGDRLGKLVPAVSGVVDGPIAAKIVADTEKKDAFRASVDLKAASIALPVIGWRKGKGVEGDLTFDLRSTDGRVELSDLVLKGDGFSAEGSVVADAKGLQTASLADVSFNPGDEVDVKVQRASNGFSVELSGERFDARPFLADLRSSLGERAAKKPSNDGAEVDVAVSLERVTGFGGEEIRDLSLNYAGNAGRIAALSIAGTDGGGGRFSADVSPRGDERSIEVRAGDAGRLADFSGLYGRMEGGALALSLLGSSDDGYAGTLAAENFALVDEPRLSRLVGSSPQQGAASLSDAVGAPLQTARAEFDHASAAIAYGKDGLRVRGGIIRGPVFGSSFSGVIFDAKNRLDITGSFMPAYGLNGMFGKIPIVGQILGNGNEGGLIGITYRLEGAFASPTLTVNPISAIAPGIFRSIFAYGP